MLEDFCKLNHTIKVLAAHIESRNDPSDLLFCSILATISIFGAGKETFSICYH